MTRTDQGSLEMMLDDIHTREARLNDWEIQFIESITPRIEAGTGLSEKQDRKFTEIWERVTDI